MTNRGVLGRIDVGLLAARFTDKVADSLAVLLSDQPVVWRLGSPVVPADGLPPVSGSVVVRFENLGANFDIHGDSATLNYFNYSKGSSESSEGVLEAEFDGKHGWFWRNRTGNTMTITLEVKGEFTEMTQEV